MLVQIVADAKLLAAFVAGVRFFTGVRAPVLCQGVRLREALVAQVARVRLFLGVDAQMAHVIVLQHKRLVAVLAHVLKIASVKFAMHGESVGMGKGLGAVRTLVGLWLIGYRRCHSDRRWITASDISDRTGFSAGRFIVGRVVLAICLFLQLWN